MMIGDIGMFTLDYRYFEYIADLLMKLGITLVVVIFPLLLIYGLLKASLDVFKKNAIKLYLLRVALFFSNVVVFIAQTTTNITDISDIPEDIIYSLISTVASVFIFAFQILLPGIALLLLWKALTKLITM